MGRIRQMIKIDGRQCWTLFDAGTRNTYVWNNRRKTLIWTPSG